MEDGKIIKSKTIIIRAIEKSISCLDGISCRRRDNRYHRFRARVSTMTYLKSKNFPNRYENVKKIGKVFGYLALLVALAFCLVIRDGFVRVPGAGPMPEWKVTMLKYWPLHLSGNGRG